MSLSTNEWSTQMIGSIIKNYVILRKVGAGGTAIVFEGGHQITGERAAIKILRPELSGNSEIRRRFKKEAELIRQLVHPGIPTFIDFEDHASRPSLVMEFLQGEDLKKRIDREGSLGKEDLIQIFDQVLLTLQHVHQEGVVLRDIKPSNIFLLPGNVVKILDFGIAKLFGEGVGEYATKIGQNVGTTAFMSPEQVLGDQSIDHRSDIYSLGITLYAACHGRLPYDTSLSEFIIYQKIVFEPLPDLMEDVFFRHLINRACNKDRQQRFQSCAEWREQLHNPVYDVLPEPETPEGPLPEPPSPPSRKWWPYLLLLLVLVGGIYWATKTEDPPRIYSEDEPNVTVPKANARLTAFYNDHIHKARGASQDTFVVDVKIIIGADGKLLEYDFINESSIFPDGEDYGIKNEIRSALMNVGGWRPAYLDEDTSKKVVGSRTIEFHFPNHDN